MDLTPLTLTYPELISVGAGARATLLGGIGHLEAGWYVSGDDKNGMIRLSVTMKYES